MRTSTATRTVLLYIGAYGKLLDQVHDTSPDTAMHMVSNAKKAIQWLRSQRSGDIALSAVLCDYDTYGKDLLS